MTDQITHDILCHMRDEDAQLSADLAFDDAFDSAIRSERIEAKLHCRSEILPGVRGVIILIDARENDTEVASEWMDRVANVEAWVEDQIEKVAASRATAAVERDLAVGAL